MRALQLLQPESWRGRGCTALIFFVTLRKLSIAPGSLLAECKQLDGWCVAALASSLQDRQKCWHINRVQQPRLCCCHANRQLHPPSVRLKGLHAPNKHQLMLSLALQEGGHACLMHKRCDACCSRSTHHPPESHAPEAAFCPTQAPLCQLAWLQRCGGFSWHNSACSAWGVCCPSGFTSR